MFYVDKRISYNYQLFVISNVQYSIDGVLSCTKQWWIITANPPVSEFRRERHGSRVRAVHFCSYLTTIFHLNLDISTKKNKAQKPINCY